MQAQAPPHAPPTRPCSMQAGSCEPMPLRKQCTHNWVLHMPQLGHHAYITCMHHMQPRSDVSQLTATWLMLCYQEAVAGTSSVARGRGCGSAGSASTVARIRASFDHGGQADPSTLALPRDPVPHPYTSETGKSCALGSCWLVLLTEVQPWPAVRASCMASAEHMSRSCG